MSHSITEGLRIISEHSCTRFDTGILMQHRSQNPQNCNPLNKASSLNSDMKSNWFQIDLIRVLLCNLRSGICDIFESRSLDLTSSVVHVKSR